MSRIWAAPQALLAACSLIQREWGETGYRVVDVESPGFSGAALLTVRASDGGTFFVAGTRYGETTHGHQSKDVCAAELQTLLAEEAKRVSERPTRAAICECYLDCADHQDTACSLSGTWHVHPGEKCPVHPDAPGDH